MAIKGDALAYQLKKLLIRSHSLYYAELEDNHPHLLN